MDELGQFHVLSSPIGKRYLAPQCLSAYASKSNRLTSTHSRVRSKKLRPSVHKPIFNTHAAQAPAASLAASRQLAHWQPVGSTMRSGTDGQPEPRRAQAWAPGLWPCVHQHTVETRSQKTELPSSSMKRSSEKRWRISLKSHQRILLGN